MRQMRRGSDPASPENYTPQTSTEASGVGEDSAIGRMANAKYLRVDRNMRGLLSKIVRMSTRRIVAFGFAIALAASPLFWFSLDPNAGDKMLRMTSKHPQHSMLPR